MTSFCLPFIVKYPDPKDFILEKCYEKKPDSYRLRIPAGKTLTTPIIIVGKPDENLNLDLTIDIGKEAEAVIKILTKASGAQNVNIKAQLIFDEAQGKGELLMRGMSTDHAKLNFDGLVQIGKKATGCVAHLKQEILNLSPHASVCANPSLKIGTNDVKAGHSAYVRNLNDEDLYYFSARGIKEDVAKKLLIDGFFGKERELV
jgi:Fe-S cluster assembly scaffold protein SufB